MNKHVYYHRAELTEVIVVSVSACGIVRML